MKITSTNLGKPTTIIWNDQEITTGIYKQPITAPIYLDKEGVRNDEVSDKLVHGGEFKACYIFSETHYQYWKYLYPDLDWNWGMFGENLTVSGLDETQIYVGDIYKLGNALVQITQPREPCFKFAYKFGTTDVLKQFISHGFSGTYIRVLEPGLVQSGDDVELVKREENSLTTAQLFHLLYDKEKDQNHLKAAIINPSIPARKRDKLRAFLKTD